ncbi:MAG: response regulator [Burkholderiales bacterium]|nr:response regulator [Burkholderiales bacterium]
MPAPRILIIDDNEDDVLLAAAQVRRAVGDARFRRVDTAAAFSSALAEQPWDLVLCDHNMPSFDSAAALAIAKAAGMPSPFFVYSGEFSRGQAADAMANGAQGVLEKRDTSALVSLIARVAAATTP